MPSSRMVVSLRLKFFAVPHKRFVREHTLAAFAARDRRVVRHDGRSSVRIKLSDSRFVVQAKFAEDAHVNPQKFRWG